MVRRVDQQVLWLDITVADAERVDVGEGAEALVNIELDKEDGHWHLHLVVVLQDTVNCLRHVLHHDIKVNLINLHPVKPHPILQIL